MVLGLNEVLVYRVFYHKKQSVQQREGVTSFLDWLRTKVDVAFGLWDVIVFTQANCMESSYRTQGKLAKLRFLKDLKTFACIVDLSFK
jgi:hypothetical protein